ncbi:MAG: CHAT domain-containing protein [Bacteroidales bacterium]|nr:CHAT domain-containing protein [Bacteroidales bacterium]
MDINRQKEIAGKYFSKDKSRYCLRQQIPENTSEYKYLNAAYEECDYVLKKAKDKNVTFFYGDSAVEESFKYCVLKRPEIIHIATHGFYDEYFSGEDELNAPLFSSSLVFAGVNNYMKNKDIPQNIDDGFLSAMEISEYDLSNTKLAVLSACETGLGFVNSDGIFGLQRGFKLSGAQSVLMSLWSISDEATSIFMRKFYASLLSGETPHQSLRIATDYLKEGNRFSHPYYWAGFVLVE